jgi:hypothetical protein
MTPPLRPRAPLGLMGWHAHVGHSRHDLDVECSRMGPAGRIQPGARFRDRSLRRPSYSGGIDR